MSVSRIPTPVRPCPPPCDRGKITIDNPDAGAMFDILIHPECGGSGLDRQASYPPVDRLRRVLEHVLGGAVPADALDRLACTLGDEVRSIIAARAADHLANHTGDAEAAAVAFRRIAAPFGNPLTFVACRTCQATGSEGGQECRGGCEGRGFVFSRQIAEVFTGDRPPL